MMQLLTLVLRRCPAVNQPHHLVSGAAVPALPAGSSGDDVLLGANVSIGKKINVFAMNVLC